MKKIKIFLFLFWLTILIAPGSISAAANNCNWRAETTQTNPEIGGYSQTNGGCYTGEKRPEGNSSTTCDMATKPGDSSSGFFSTRYICCCENTVLSPGATPPKFEIPEMQIDIPTVNLTGATCQANDDGTFFCQIPWLGQYLSGIYDYGLSIAGILAAIILMAGGVLWLVSGGDAGKITQAKELIIGSVVGLIILFSAYLILFQVNPELVKTKSVSIGTLQNMDFEPISNDGNPSGSTECNNCVDIKNIPCKNGKKSNFDLVKKLYGAWGNSGTISWRITEAYPPSSKHNSTCHHNGMCVDIALFPATNPVDCAEVDKLIGIIQNAGLKIYNEYLACNGKKTTYTTGGHLHVR